MRTTRALLLTVLPASLAILAGCGGDVAEKNEYVDKVNAAQQRFVKSTESLAASNPAEVVDALGEIRTGVEKVADEIEAIEPPEDVKDSHAKLVDVLRDFTAELDTATKAISSEKDPAKQAAAAQELLSTINATSQKFNAAIDEINTKLKE